MSNKLNIGSLSDIEIQDLFEKAFQDQVASYNNIQEFEVSCNRETGSNKADVEVTIYGFAGSPCIDDFKEAKLKHTKLVTIERETKGQETFKLVPEDTVFVNSNDYTIIYRN